MARTGAENQARNEGVGFRSKRVSSEIKQGMIGMARDGGAESPSIGISGAFAHSGHYRPSSASVFEWVFAAVFPGLGFSESGRMADKTPEMSPNHAGFR